MTISKDFCKEFHKEFLKNLTSVPQRIPKEFPKNFQDFENIQFSTSHLKAEHPFGLVFHQGQKLTDLPSEVKL